MKQPDCKDCGTGNGLCNGHADIRARNVSGQRQGPTYEKISSNKGEYDVEIPLSPLDELVSNIMEQATRTDKTLWARELRIKCLIKQFIEEQKK